jgi:regulator of protease activity HflC (stomatin/prohibitin superfamily)
MYIFILLVLVAFLLITFRTVRQNTVVIVERFGKFHRVLDSGLNMIVPLLDKPTATISLALQNLHEEVDAVTRDKVTVKIEANLVYQVDRTMVKEFHYDLSDAMTTVRDYVENYMRSHVAAQTHEELLLEREEFSTYLIDSLDDILIKWGIRIVSFQVINIIFPTEITDAMSKVVASQRLREAAQNEAEANKVTVIKNAEANKEASIMLGEGIAGQKLAIMEGLKMSVKDIQDVQGFEPNEIMNLLVISQYFDTIKDVGSSGNTKVMFLNPAPEGANQLIQQLSSAIEASK